jgi:hypothetical protein
MHTTGPITVTGIETTSEELVLVLGARRICIAWGKCSPILASASEAERFTAELSPGAYGIHWRLLDEDLSVNGLMRDLD